MIISFVVIKINLQATSDFYRTKLREILVNYKHKSIGFMVLDHVF